MKANIATLETDLKTTKRSADTADRYVDLMETFLKEAQSQFETLECMHTRMSEAYKSLGDYFAFEVAKYPLGELCADLKTFAAQFEQCVEDNQRARDTEQKIRRAEQERAAREKEREARKTQKERLMTTGAMPTITGAKGKGPIGIAADSSADMGDTGVMDNLYVIRLSYFLRCVVDQTYIERLEALQSGRLFEAGSPGGPPGGRGRRPMRRDQNLMGRLRFRLDQSNPMLNRRVLF